MCKVIVSTAWYCIVTVSFCTQLWSSIGTEEVKKLRGKRTAPGQQKIFKIWQLDYGEGASVGWVVDFYIV